MVGAELQQGLAADTALRVDAMGESSLEHIVGGPGNLWARFHFDDSDNRNDIDPCLGGGVLTVSKAAEGEGSVHSASLMLLAARLQGAVAVGRGPAVARALTATVSPRGGEWMLPNAGPVQVRENELRSGDTYFVSTVESFIYVRSRLHVNDFCWFV